jgi:hypothetical protein
MHVRLSNAMATIGTDEVAPRVGVGLLGASGYDYTEQFERGLEHILNAIEQSAHEELRVA